jgi:hypothetical protein
MNDMDPRLWLYLDNLRCRWGEGCNLTVEQLQWARAEARAKGFVNDEPKADRLTHKGEIALRLSLDSGGDSCYT